MVAVATSAGRVRREARRWKRQRNSGFLQASEAQICRVSPFLPSAGFANLASAPRSGTAFDAGRGMGHHAVRPDRRGRLSYDRASSRAGGRNSIRVDQRHPTTDGTRRRSSILRSFLFQIGPQAFPNLDTGAEKQALHRRNRRVEHLGDFLVRRVLETPQDHGHPRLLG